MAIRRVDAAGKSGHMAADNHPLGIMWPHIPNSGVQMQLDKGEGKTEPEVRQEKQQGTAQ